jgi:hypothetical protein
LTVVRPGVPAPSTSADDTTLSLDEFRRWLTSGRVLAHLGRHGRPLPLALALRAVCRGDICLEDARGRRLPLTIARLASWSGQLASEPFRVGALLRAIEREVAALEHAAPERTALKTKNHTLKHVLKRAVRGLIPDSLVTRPKQGFGVPVDELFMGPLASVASRELDRFCRETDLLDPAEVRRVMTTADGAKRWYLMNLALWWRTFLAER